MARWRPFKKTISFVICLKYEFLSYGRLNYCSSTDVHKSKTSTQVGCWHIFANVPYNIRRIQYIEKNWPIRTDWNRCIERVGHRSIKEKKNVDSQFTNAWINEPMRCHWWIWEPVKILRRGHWANIGHVYIHRITRRGSIQCYCLSSHFV